MPNTEHDLQVVENTISKNKAAIDLGIALHRLHHNKDFKTIITKGFFQDRAMDLVLAKATPAADTPEEQATIIKSIDAIGELWQYFFAIKIDSDNALKEIEGHEQTREELLQEVI